MKTEQSTKCPKLRDRTQSFGLDRNFNSRLTGWDSRNLSGIAFSVCQASVSSNKGKENKSVKSTFVALIVLTVGPVFLVSTVDFVVSEE